MSPMNARVLSVVSLLLAAGSVSLLAGCSGHREDTRVTFCRQLAANQTDTGLDQWKSAGNRFKSQDYAAVSVAGPHAQTAVCYYDFDAQEQGALELANPMLAYATLPYQMKLNGKVVPRDQLKQATMAQQVQYVRDVAHQARQTIDQAADQARKAIQPSPDHQ